MLKTLELSKTLSKTVQKALMHYVHKPAKISSLCVLFHFHFLKMFPTTHFPYMHLCKQAIIKTGAGATFDWTLFNNWNKRKFVQRLQKVAMFDSDYVRRETAIIEHKIN